jgi:hypothetical protein
MKKKLKQKEKKIKQKEKSKQKVNKKKNMEGLRPIFTQNGHLAI